MMRLSLVLVFTAIASGRPNNGDFGESLKSTISESFSVLSVLSFKYSKSTHAEYH